MPQTTSKTHPISFLGLFGNSHIPAWSIPGPEKPVTDIARLRVV